MLEENRSESARSIDSSNGPNEKEIYERQIQAEKISHEREAEYYSVRHQHQTNAQTLARKKIILIGLAMKQKFGLLENQFIAYSNHLAKPDFLLPKYGAVIEIDGSCHNGITKMCADKCAEEKVYTPLGLKVFRYTNEQLYSMRGMIHFLSDLRWIFCHPLSRKEAACLRSKISQHRRSLDNSSVLNQRFPASSRLPESG